KWVCDVADCNGDPTFTSTIVISDSAFASGDFTGVAGNVLSWDTSSGVGDGFTVSLADILSANPGLPTNDYDNLRIVLSGDGSLINDLLDISTGTNITFDSNEGRVDFFEGTNTNYSVGSLRDGPIGSTFSDIIIQGQFQVVPVPAAAWLFGSGLIALVGFSRKRVAK
ncbi:MAG: hypothetical protein KJO91_04245, partial [Gammaproteobacteria bacterium]|nr:hypothetical protein [Gammaproteobacteria bacterium]